MEVLNLNRKLSIIIPHYNDFILLKDLLNSIDLSNDVEVIIVDDYSDQKILKDIELFLYENNWDNVRLIKNYSTKSAGTCRNIGVDNSRGSWIVFADADDYFLSNMYEIIHPYLTSDNDIVYFTPTSIYLDTGKIAQRHLSAANVVTKYIENPSHLTSINLRTKFIEPWSKIYKSSFIKENNIRFDDTPIANDVFFSVKSGVLADKIAASKQQIYCVTKSSNSITTFVSKDRFEIRFLVFLKEVQFLKENLDTNDFISLNIDGKAWMINSILNKFGIKYTLSILRRLNQNGIRLVALENVTFKKFILFLKDWKEDHKYRNKSN